MNSLNGEIWIGVVDEELVTTIIFIVLNLLFSDDSMKICLLLINEIEYGFRMRVEEHRPQTILYS